MSALALGLDVGGTNARAAVVNRDSGELIAVHKEPLVDRTPTGVVEIIGRAARAAAKAVDKDLHDFGTIGVGLAAQCKGATGYVYIAPNLGWRNVPIGDILTRALGMRVRIANDLNAAAWGEKLYGAARGVSNAVLV